MFLHILLMKIAKCEIYLVCEYIRTTKGALGIPRGFSSILGFESEVAAILMTGEFVPPITFVCIPLVSVMDECPQAGILNRKWSELYYESTGTTHCLMSYGLTSFVPSIISSA